MLPTSMNTSPKPGSPLVTVQLLFDQPSGTMNVTGTSPKDAAALPGALVTGGGVVDPADS